MVIMLAVTCTGPKQVATADQVWSAIEQAGYQPVDATDLFRDDMPGLVQCIAFEKDGEYFTFYLKTEGSAMLICLAVFALFFSYGLYMIFSSFTQKSKRRRSAVYAVTTKRVIFAKVDADGNMKKMESIPLERAGEGNLITGKSGVGTITFWSAATTGLT